MAEDIFSCLVPSRAFSGFAGGQERKRRKARLDPAEPVQNGKNRRPRKAPDEAGGGQHGQPGPSVVGRKRRSRSEARLVPETMGRGVRWGSEPREEGCHIGYDRLRSGRGRNMVSPKPDQGKPPDLRNVTCSCGLLKTNP